MEKNHFAQFIKRGQQKQLKIINQFHYFQSSIKFLKD